MVYVFERLSVRCPYSEAHASVSADALARVGAMPPFVLSLERLNGSSPLDDRVHVHWGPKDGGVFPEFDGEIVLRTGCEAGTAVLELTGAYAQPQGAKARAWATRIVDGTAKHVLRKLADALESPAQ